jgi:hypothetical protein
MARGWESKAVEGQMEDSRKDKEVAAAARAAHSPARAARHSREHENLLLAKTRLMKDIESTQNPRYRQFLETSLAAVEKQLSEME